MNKKVYKVYVKVSGPLFGESGSVIGLANDPGRAGDKAMSHKKKAIGKSFSARCCSLRVTSIEEIGTPSF